MISSQISYFQQQQLRQNVQRYSQCVGSFNVLSINTVQDILGGQESAYPHPTAHVYSSKKIPHNLYRVNTSSKIGY